MKEYRAYLCKVEIHEVSEANAYKIRKKVEDILIQTHEFKLPSRKEICEDLDIQVVVVVDISESAIEHHENTRNIRTLARRSTLLKSR